jgi:hypothetical protein
MVLEQLGNAMLDGAVPAAVICLTESRRQNVRRAASSIGT